MAIVDFGSQYKRTGQFPLLIEDTFGTLALMNAYLANANENHHPGQLISVTDDPTAGNNGLYIISGSASARTSTQILNKVQVTELINSLISAGLGNLSGALVYKGLANTSNTVWTNAVTNHKTGWTFIVSVAGTYVGQKCEVGDMLICNADGTSSNNVHWNVLQTNIDGAVISAVTSSTDSEIVVFSGTSGKQIKGSGKTLIQILQEARNLSLMEGVLPIGKGGTGQTTVQGVKDAFGVTAAEEEIEKIKEGTTKVNASATADKLSSVRCIDGINFDGSGNVTHFGTCTTEGNVAAKVTTVSNYVLYPGGSVKVKFTNANTVANPTLSISGTGAKPIFYKGAAIPAGYLKGETVFDFVYNGTQYDLVGEVNTERTLATVAPNAPGVASAGSSTSVAREDHVHPVQTSVYHSSLATKLQNQRKISIEGPRITTSSKYFDGSSDISFLLNERMCIDMYNADDTSFVSDQYGGSYLRMTGGVLGSIKVNTVHASSGEIGSGTNLELWNGRIELYLSTDFAIPVDLCKQQHDEGANTVWVGNFTYNNVRYSVLAYETGDNSLRMIFFKNRGTTDELPDVPVGWPQSSLKEAVGVGFEYYDETTGITYQLDQNFDWLYEEYVTV